MSRFLLFIFLLMTLPLQAQTDSLKLIFGGDAMGHGMQITGAWRDGGDTSYNYLPVFEHVKSYISTADVAIANLEVTLAGAPYTGYPQFSTHHSFAEALKDAGFHILVTANNHCVDRGKKGLEKTIDWLDSLEIVHTGTFKDSASFNDTYPLIFEKNNFRLALLNYTYGTNGIRVQVPNIVNQIDTIRIRADLAKIDSLQVDYTIVCIHWGDEYMRKENAVQRKLSRFLTRNGADLIIGAHPHVVQPFEYIARNDNDSVPVIYSLGNLVSNQRDRYRDGGILLEVNLTKTDSIVSVQSCGYEPVWVHRFKKGGTSVFRLIPVTDVVAGESFPEVSTEDKKLMTQFYNDTKTLLHNIPFAIKRNDVPDVDIK